MCHVDHIIYSACRICSLKCHNHLLGIQCLFLVSYVRFVCVYQQTTIQANHAYWESSNQRIPYWQNNIWTNQHLKHSISCGLHVLFVCTSVFCKKCVKIISSYQSAPLRSIEKCVECIILRAMFKKHTKELQHMQYISILHFFKLGII